MDRLVRSIAIETSIPIPIIPEVIEDLLAMISSQMEEVSPDLEVEVALSPGQLRDQIMEWGYRAEDISEKDVDKILSRLIQEMTAITSEAAT